jgi:signal transduction histidine kinase
VATDGAEVVLDLRRKGDELCVQVADDGVGLPAGFTLDASTGLGLSIVRTLVSSELGGTIELRTGDGPAPRPGTVVELHVPIPHRDGG